MSSKCKLVEKKTSQVKDWFNTLESTEKDAFKTAQKIVRRLGAFYNDGYTTICIWTPAFVENQIPEEDVVLEVFNPTEPIDLEKTHQQVDFTREFVPLSRYGEYTIGIIEGMRAGTKDQIGSFYWLRYKDTDGTWNIIRDPLAHSVPFGIFGPAELYDMYSLSKVRKDGYYYESLERTEITREGSIQIRPPTNILQVHVGTASAEGTLRNLTQIYKRINEKMRDKIALSPAEQNYIGYDAVQLMPIEPIVEYENVDSFWRYNSTIQNLDTKLVSIDLIKPDMTNWGYDVVIAGSAAINPVILGSGRPDELIDFISTLHNFSKPIKVIFDIVFGHADNQGLEILNQHFFAGPNQYGQDLNFQHPVVRAIMLEMQRRKGNFGVDGLRVDGAQDFKYWDTEAQQLKYDDAYLREMSAIVQKVQGIAYYPWMIFEDGRPWPRKDWELASTYREVINDQSDVPNLVQWGPLTFAHNTPFLYTFWVQKMWRIREIVDVGGDWISGCSNHDTVRRGTQVETDSRINDKLGETLPDILNHAYNNPAEKLLFYCCLPGIPMDFINANMEAPWSYFRNTDDKYGVKVAAEEKLFLDWQVHPEEFQRDGNFTRLKQYGFKTLAGLSRFMRILLDTVDITNYDLAAMIQILAAIHPPLEGPELKSKVDVPTLKVVCKAWFDDIYDFCNVSTVLASQDEDKADFNLRVRQFRQQRPWLRDNIQSEKGECFGYLHPCDGTVLFYGLRISQLTGEKILFLANMEGEPITVQPVELPKLTISGDGWKIALATPSLEVTSITDEITLRNSEGVVFTK